jgi:hypothetical protein
MLQKMGLCGTQRPDRSLEALLASRGLPDATTAARRALAAGTGRRIGAIAASQRPAESCN